LQAKTCRELPTLFNPSHTNTDLRRRTALIERQKEIRVLLTQGRQHLREYQRSVKLAS
jgi:hypothetical protein